MPKKKNNKTQDKTKKTKPTKATTSINVANLTVSTPTQQFLEIEEVINNILITKNGTFCALIEVFPTNFALLSTEEQEHKIRQFAALINSLDFTLQIVIDTKKLFVSEYIKYLDKINPEHHTPGLRRMFLIYKRFINNIIVNQKVFQKRFFLVIPYYSNTTYRNDLPIATKETLLEQAANYLHPKTSHTLGMIQNMGLNAKVLTTQEIIKYFYSVYNPDKRQIPIEEAQITIS